jgi:hypothetical protein
MRYWVEFKRGEWHGPFRDLWYAESVAREAPGGRVVEVWPDAKIRSLD